VSKFIINPKFKSKFNNAMREVVANTTDKLAEFSRQVIETDRYWEGWVTSNPVRDIVDTNAMNESMTTELVTSNKGRISWFAVYAIYVYYGYVTQTGARIPPRMWVHIALMENNLLAEAQEFLNTALNK
jgi:hypothetical protein